MGSPCGRLTRHSLELNGVATFGAHELRPGRVLPLPRDGGVLPSGQSCTPLQHPVCRALRDEASGSSLVFTLSVFPLPVAPDGRGLLGVSPGFAPRGYPRRTPGWGRALDTGPGLHLRHQSILLSVLPLVACRFVSHAPAVTPHRHHPVFVSWPHRLIIARAGRPAHYLPVSLSHPASAGTSGPDRSRPTVPQTTAARSPPPHQTTPSPAAPRPGCSARAGPPDPGQPLVLTGWWRLGYRESSAQRPA